MTRDAAGLTAGDLKADATREAELADLRAANTRLQQQLRRAKASKEELVAAVHQAARDAAVTVGPPPKIPAPKLTKSKLDPHVALLHTTDWQCIAEGTVVLDVDGLATRIEAHPAAWATGERDVVELIVNGGGSVRLTSDHRVMVRHGWTEAGALRRGDKVVVCVGQDKWQGWVAGLSELALLGLLTSDGSVDKPGQSPKFTNTDTRLLERAEQAAQMVCGIEAKWYPKGNGFDLLFTGTGGPNVLTAWWREWQPDHGFPTRIFATSPNDAGRFLAYVMSGDGCFTTRGSRRQPSIEIACGLDPIFARYMQALLGKCGVLSSVRSEMMKDSTAPFHRVIVCAGAQNVERFATLVRPHLETKVEALDRLLEYHVGRRRISEPDVWMGPNGEWLSERRVLSVNPAGRTSVYDMEVPDKGWFVAQGVVVHNCGKQTEDYSASVLERRLNLMLDKTETLTSRHGHPVPEAVVLFGGDDIEGVNIFPTQPFEIHAGLYEQVFAVVRMKRMVVDRMLALFPKVTVRRKWGNHGRIGKFGELPDIDNLDLMADTFAAEAYKGHPRVDWHASNMDYVQQFRIGNYHAALLHGNEFYKSFSAQRIVNKVTSWQTIYGFGDVYMGHFHRTDEYGLPNGTKVYMTGSTESSNAYAADQLAARTDPSQRLHYIDPNAGRVMSSHLLWL